MITDTFLPGHVLVVMQCISFWNRQFVLTRLNTGDIVFVISTTTTGGQFNTVQRPYEKLRILTCMTKHGILERSINFFDTDTLHEWFQKIA